MPWLRRERHGARIHHVLEGPDGGLVVDRSGRHLYLAAIDHFEGFDVDRATGALTPIAGSRTTVQEATLAIHPNGELLFVGSGGAAPRSIVVYALDPASGALTPAGETAELSGSMFLAKITPDGAFLLTSDQSNIGFFSVDAGTGALSPVAGSPFAVANHFITPVFLPAP